MGKNEKIKKSIDLVLYFERRDEVRWFYFFEFVKLFSGF